MDIDYDKKDIKESPKVKKVAKKKSELPEGWGYYVKRGSHCVLDPDGKQQFKKNISEISETMRPRKTQSDPMRCFKTPVTE